MGRQGLIHSSPSHSLSGCETDINANHHAIVKVDDQGEAVTPCLKWTGGIIANTTLSPKGREGVVTLSPKGFEGANIQHHESWPAGTGRSGIKACSEGSRMDPLTSHVHGGRHSAACSKDNAIVIPGS